MNFLYAQERTISGKVSNAQGEALPFSTVVLLNLPDSAYLGFTTTNNNGNFTIRFNATGDAVLQASHMGYVTQRRQLRLGETNQVVDFTLETSTTELTHVSINARMLGARVRGDTIIYNLGAYTDDTERVLRDILEKLPGIEVDASGRVSVEGRPVTVLIDGKEFFLDQSQMATRNIPAKMVESVELIHNHREIGILRSEEESQGITVLNIGIKDQYRNRMSGVLTGGAGLMSKYYGKANLFNFSKNLSLATLLDANNTGEMAFTMNDYVQFQGVRFMRSGGGVNRGMTMDATDVPRQSFSEDVARKIGQTGAFNLSYHHPNNKLKINSYTIANRQEQHGEMTSRRWTSTNVDNTPFSVDALTERSRFNFVNSYIGTDYQPSNNFFISNRSMIFWQNRDLNNLVAREMIAQSDSLTVDEDVSTFDFRNYLLLMYRNKAGSVLTAEGFYRVNHRPSILNLLSDRPFMNLPFSPVGGGFAVMQDNTQNIHEASTYVDYAHRLGSFFLRPNIGINYLHQYLNPMMFQLINGIEIPFLPENYYSNTVRYNNTNAWAGLMLSRNVGMFRLSAGTNMHYFRTNLENVNRDSLIENNQWKFLPNAEISLNFANANRLSLSFNLTEETRQISNLNESKVVTDYQNIGMGKAVDHLRNPTFSASIRYFYTNFFKGTTLTAFSTYRRQTQTLTMNYINHPGFTESTIVESPDNSSFNANLRFRQSLQRWPVDVRLSVNYTLNSHFNYINGEENAIVLNLFRVDLALMTFTKGILNGELGGEITWLKNESKLMNRTMQLTTLAPYLKLRANMGKGWTTTASVQYFKYDANDIQRDVTNISSSVVYVPQKGRFEFELSANNILNFNKTEKITSAYTRSIFEERIIQTLPGFLIFKVTYRL